MFKGLYNIFKHWYHGGRIYFYSDPHFDDKNIPKIRANYITDDEQIKRINSKIGKCDTIIFLGDIGDVEYIKKIRGYKVLIKGNHDKGSSNYQESFNEIYEGALTISDKIVLSHEPIKNLPEYFINIHGHDHNNNYIDEKHINVCAEYINYIPVDFTNIMKLSVYKDIKSIHRITINEAIKRKENREDV